VHLDDVVLGRREEKEDVGINEGLGFGGFGANGSSRNGREKGCSG